MRSIKMLSLAALAALLAMAFVGASSAMAEGTDLCSGETTPCEAIRHVHETSVGKGKLKSSLPTIECTVLFLGDAKAGAPLVISGTFTYSSCNNFCTVKEENGPSEIKVLRTATELANVTGEGLVHVSCPFINCNYIGEGLEGHGLGPLTSSSANGSVVLTERKTEKESGSCPEEAFLTLTTTPLKPTYIIKSELHYCVDYERANSGYFLNSTCTEEDSTRLGKYALVVAPAGAEVGKHLCVDLLDKVGLYKDSACTTKSTNDLYELAKIVTVQ